MPVLQFANVAVLLLQVFFRFLPSVWIVLVIILWEGLLGGAVYANAFYKMTYELPEERREFCLGVGSLADTFGTIIAAVVSIPVHNAICDMKLKI